MKVYLLIYDSESDCDRLEGVYKSKYDAVHAARRMNKKTCECEHDCDCGRVKQVKRFTTKSMDWGPALEVGTYYVIEKDVEPSSDTKHQTLFRNKLESMEYEIVETCECPNSCKNTEKTDAYYFSECLCCDPTSLKWYRRWGCSSCINGSLGSLDCGGHYSEIYVFHNEEYVPDVDNWDDPNDLPIKTPYERLGGYVEEYINDLPDVNLLTKMVYDGK